MKKVLKVLMLGLILTLLAGCKKKEDYSDFEDLHVRVKDAFSQPEKEYYLYFYTDRCRYCNKLKPLVFKQAKNKELPLYFVSQKQLGAALKMTTDPKHSNYSVTSLKEVEIYGFPTMMLLRNGRVIQEFVGFTKIDKELKNS